MTTQTAAGGPELRSDVADQVDRKPRSSRAIRAEQPKQQRAVALTPDERREAIAMSTLALILEHGPAVTTREIAEAAGVAEGTIFRVFPDKESVINAALVRAFDPAALRTAISEIDRKLPLAARLEAAVELMQMRVTRIFQLMSFADEKSAVPGRPSIIPPGAHQYLADLAELFEPDADKFDMSPLGCAHLLRAVTFGSTHPLFVQGAPLSAAEIVRATLHGACGPSAPETEPSEGGDASC